MSWDNEVPFSTLLGLTLASVERADEENEILFTATDGRRFRMYHDQNCCEDVTIESIVGDLQDLVGEPILRAEEVSLSNENPPDAKLPEYQDSFTWTFYKLATRKGYVDIRWYGASNGYYSESVSLEELKD